MSTPANWFKSATDFLDERGKGAWIAAMVVGFIFVWPVGLGILFYMLWSKRMCRSFFKSKSCNRSNRGETGNTAFDAYREDTLQRLEDEQSAFQGFLQKLREAKDKSEFDNFMDDRAKDVKNASA